MTSFSRETKKEFFSILLEGVHVRRTNRRAADRKTMVIWRILPTAKANFMHIVKR
jgi:hypothetical protein